jgi:hypothetical protein
MHFIPSIAKGRAIVSAVGGVCTEQSQHVYVGSVCLFCEPSGIPDIVATSSSVLSDLLCPLHRL